MQTPDKTCDRLRWWNPRNTTGQSLKILTSLKFNIWKRHLNEPIHDIDSGKVAQPRIKAREAARFFATSSLRTPRVSTVLFACLEKLGFNGGLWAIWSSVNTCADFACNVAGWNQPRINWDLRRSGWTMLRIGHGKMASQNSCGN